MPTYHTYNVIPTLPAALEPLREMVFNLWWTWEPSARRLFRHALVFQHRRHLLQGGQGGEEVEALKDEPAMVEPKAVAERNFGRIRGLARQYVGIVQQTRKG